MENMAGVADLFAKTLSGLDVFVEHAKAD